MPFERIDYERRDIDGMREAVQKLDSIPGLPVPIVGALVASLTAAADELENRRPLPRELRRAAMHVVTAVDEVLAGHR